MSFYTRTAAAAAVAALVAGTAALAQDTLTIGIMVPTTGSEATYGQDMANAVNLAIGEINAAGGVLGKQLTIDRRRRRLRRAAGGQRREQARLARASSASSAATAPAPRVPTLKIYGDAKLPLIITAANSTKLIPANPGNAFMINSTGNDQVAKAIEYFSAKGIKSIAIVNQGDAYSQDLADLTKKTGKRPATRSPPSRPPTRASRTIRPSSPRIKCAQPGRGVLDRLLRRWRPPDPPAPRESATRASSPSATARTRSETLQDRRPGGRRRLRLLEPDRRVPARGQGLRRDLPEAQFGNGPGPYSTLTYDGMQLLAWAIDHRRHHRFGQVIARRCRRPTSPNHLPARSRSRRKRTRWRARTSSCSKARAAPGRWRSNRPDGAGTGASAPVSTAGQGRGGPREHFRHRHASAGERASCSALVLRAGGARLHHGLRRREAAELRPWRPLHGRRLRRLPGALGFLAPFLGAGWLGVAVSMVFAMLAVGFLGVVIERVAYAPMLSAPRLSILITALAVSLVLQNAMLTLTKGQYVAVRVGPRLRRHQPRQPVHQLQPDDPRRHRGAADARRSSSSCPAPSTAGRCAPCRSTRTCAG